MNTEEDIKKFLKYSKFSLKFFAYLSRRGGEEFLLTTNSGIYNVRYIPAIHTIPSEISLLFFGND